MELHLDKIYPHRDIVAMKTNNIASYSDVLVTCMRQNPKWILLSEVRSAEAVSAVRNSISSGHNILSTIHSDKANAIPHRMYSLMETDLDVDQFLNTIYRYVQLGVHIKAYYSPKYKKFHREIDEITEFYIDEDNKPIYNIIYQKTMSGKIVKKNPSQHLLDYLAAQNIDIGDTTFDSEDSGGLSLEDVVGEKSEEEVLKEQKAKEEARKQTEAEAEELEPEAIVDPSTKQAAVDTLEEEKKSVVQTAVQTPATTQVAPKETPVQGTTVTTSPTPSQSVGQAATQATNTTPSTTTMTTVQPVTVAPASSSQAPVTPAPIASTVTTVATQTTTPVQAAPTTQQPTTPVQTTASGVTATNNQIPIVSFDGTNTNPPIKDKT